jgi:hypothetical protein
MRFLVRSDGIRVGKEFGSGELILFRNASTIWKS